MRVEDKHHFPEDLKWVKFSSIDWTHDHKGFFYQVCTIGGSCEGHMIHKNGGFFLLLQRYPEVKTESAGKEVTQVLGHQVREGGRGGR